MQVILTRGRSCLSTALLSFPPSMAGFLGANSDETYPYDRGARRERGARPIRLRDGPEQHAARDAVAGSLRRDAAAAADRRSGGRRAAIRRRRRTGSAVVAALSLRRARRAGRRRAERESDACRNRKDARRRAAGTARAGRRIDAAVARRECAGGPHPHAGHLRHGRADPALQRVRRSVAGALHVRSVRHHALRERGERRAGRLASSKRRGARWQPTSSAPPSPLRRSTDRSC